MQTKAIKYDAVVGQGASQYYGTIILSNIRHDDGSAVRVQKYFTILFKAPASVPETAFTVSTRPWVEVHPKVTNEQIDSTTFAVAAKLHVASPVSMSDGATITIGVDGDLTKHPERYLESFVMAADSVPDINGTVTITCPPAPDPAFAGREQQVTFTMGGRVVTVNVPLDEATPVKVPAGTYTVTAAELVTEAQTVVAHAKVHPASIEIEAGGSADVKITYGKVAMYGAMDVTIGDIPGFENERFHVKVVDSHNKVLEDFVSPINHTTHLRRLPSSGTVKVSVEGSIRNNVEYSFHPKKEHLSSSLISVSFMQEDLHSKPIDTDSFVTLPVVVTGDDVSLSSSISVRLTSQQMVYTQMVDAKAGSTEFDVLVAPADYKVQVMNIVHHGTVYVVDAPDTLNVNDDGSTTLELMLHRGANLMVRGFPGFLSFGGCTNLVPGNEADFVAARASSIFKYAGNDGAGDAGGYLADDPATTRTIGLARDIEKKLDDGNPVLPVMISYTCNLSGGDAAQQLHNEAGLAHSFGNLILSLNIANSLMDDEHPTPCGYVINPDFLGACQQDKFEPDYEMKVRHPLRSALHHRGVEADIPETIEDNLRGYVHAVNWLIRTVSPACTFGWQVNLWGVGSSAWVYGDDDVAQYARETADYARKLGAFDDEYLPDFLAVDRYEADDFTVRSYGNGYCYGPREWERFFDFCAALSSQLQFPIMPWQIPSSWTPLTTDAVNDDFDSQHWGTGGSYIFGDPGIGSDYHNVNHKILALEFNPALKYMGKTAKDIFIRAEPFDLTEPKYGDFPSWGIFAVLLGGGSTTGIVSSIGNPQPWVRDKLHHYMKQPIVFDDQGYGRPRWEYCLRSTYEKMICLKRKKLGGREEA